DRLRRGLYPHVLTFSGEPRRLAYDAPMTFRFLAAIALFALASPAFAWGRLGHRLVAELAQDELTRAAQAPVEALPRGRPDPTLAGIAAWADEVRAKDPGLGKRSAPWHYVTIHGSACAYDAATDCKGDNCVVGAIDRQAAILADRTRSLDERRIALKFVVH